MAKKKEPLLTEGEWYAIDWLDSGMQIVNGWDTVTDHLKNWRLNDMRVSTVGAFAYEDDDVVGLALSSTSESHVFGLQLIVKNNIISVKRLISAE